MMNQSGGSMHPWAGGGMWIWAVAAFVLVILLVVAISKLPKK